MEWHNEANVPPFKKHLNIYGLYKQRNEQSFNGNEKSKEDFKILLRVGERISKIDEKENKLHLRLSTEEIF